MKKYEEEIAQRTEIDAQLQKRITELNEEIERAKKVITKGENLVGRMYDARELNGRIRSHYNFLSIQDNVERQKVLQYDIDEYNRLEEIVKYLEVQ